MGNSWFTKSILEKRVIDNDFLSSVDLLLDWDSLTSLLSKIHLRDVSKVGRKSYSKLTMLKAILLQQWYNLSDVELENNLKDRLSFIKFCQLDLEGKIPDHSTICRFRNKLIKHKIHNKILKEINNQISSQGISIKSGSVVDASLIKAHSRPNRKELIDIEPVGDEENTETQYKVSLDREESKDHDARWIKKGKKSVYGYKANISVDPQTGLVQENITTPANIHDVKTLPTLLSSLQLEEESMVLADKGYSSKAIRSLIKTLGYKPRVMFKKYKNDILKNLKTRFNKKVSKTRYIVEQTFGCLHAHYDFGRTPYVGLAKADYFLTMKCVAFNIKKTLKLCTI